MYTIAGKILISAPSLQDPNFNKAVIFITEHNEKGAIGFVINKLFSRAFNELAAFSVSPPIPLFNGGPVQTDQLYFLHRRPGLITGGINVTGVVYTGGNFNQAVQCINEGTVTARDIKLCIGYCGWDPSELEAEMAEGSWLVCDTDSEIVFSQEVDMLWEVLSAARR